MNQNSSGWDKFYSANSLHETPSHTVIELVPRLKADGVVEILDAGCGAGRHSHFFSRQGFNVHGVDISEEAIRIAKTKDGSGIIDYRVASLTDLPFPPESMDFILAHHSLEYASYGDIQRSVAKLGSVLKKGRRIFVRVISTKHPFYRISPDKVYGVSHVGFCITNGLPVHFFCKGELLELFYDYDVELTHVEGGVHPKITVPLREWVLFGRKR